MWAGLDRSAAPPPRESHRGAGWALSTPVSPCLLGRCHQAVGELSCWSLPNNSLRKSPEPSVPPSKALV